MSEYTAVALKEGAGNCEYEKMLQGILQEVFKDSGCAVLAEFVGQLRRLALNRRQGISSAEDELKDAISQRLFVDDQLQDAFRAASMLTLYFDLDNLAEEQERIRRLRDCRHWEDKDYQKMSIRQVIAAFKQQGIRQEELAELLKSLRIELVLTAHPSENKRRTILSKHEEIAEILFALETQNLLPLEINNYKVKLKAAIAGLWHTNRARTAKPTTEDEVRAGLYFVENTFWQTFPQIYAELNQALDEYYPGTTKPDHAWLHLGSWIGGDRDGNPYVTYDITAETLRLHRGLMVRLYSELFHRLERICSIAVDKPSEELQQVLKEVNQLATDPLISQQTYFHRVIKRSKRYPHEICRVALAYLAAKLIWASNDDMKSRLLSTEVHSPLITRQEIARVLNAVENNVPKAIAEAHLRPVHHLLAAFGLYAAPLHLREDAEQIKKCLVEILRVVVVDSKRPEVLDTPVATVQEIIKLLETDSKDILRKLVEDKTFQITYAHAMQHLSRWISKQRPPENLAEHVGVTRETENTWRLFRLIAHARKIYGPEIFGPFIISMTHCSLDILTVLLLANWTSWDTESAEHTGNVQPLIVAPLFETIDALAAAPQILKQLFEAEVYRNYLRTCGDEQLIVLGYSDSNKDGGYLAANWKLYMAKAEIQTICDEFKITFSFMHGRGGSIARGGGPTHRAILAQPLGTVNCRMSVTEQGETISANYLNPHLAHRNLEQMVSAVLYASRLNAHEAIDVRPEWLDGMGRMADIAQATYRKLINDKVFQKKYWRRVTPISEIERLQLSARPSSRMSGNPDEFKVRAIPWVFSWMQSRFNLPGWFGLGTGLTQLDLPLLHIMYEGWPFFRSLLDNAEMSLLKADMGIAEEYSMTLIHENDKELERAIFSQIKTEYNRTVELILQITKHDKLLDDIKDQAIQQSIERRNPNVDPLNFLQIQALRQLWRLTDEKGDKALNTKEAEPIRQVIVVTINGIAAALRNTG